jgi:hypothetical protein
MTQETQASWTGMDGPGDLTDLLPGSNLTVELLQVAVFLAAFSGFYFAVSAVSDEAYRDQFFTSVKRELDRAVAVRTLYVELRGRGRDEPADRGPVPAG